MRALILEVETTGLLDYRADAAASHQPHIVAIGAAIYESGEPTQNRFYSLIRPEGYTIPDTAVESHGITHREAARCGIPIKTALSVVMNFAQSVNTCASYGFETFDAKVIRCALAHLKVDRQFPPTGVEGYCVKKAAAAICKLPGEGGDYKPPDLATASMTILHRPLRSRKVTDQIEIVAELFFELKSRGL